MDTQEIKNFIDLLVQIEIGAVLICVIHFIIGKNPILFIVIAMIVCFVLSILNVIEGNLVSGLLWAVPPAIFLSALDEM